MLGAWKFAATDPDLYTCRHSDRFSLGVEDVTVVEQTHDPNLRLTSSQLLLMLRSTFRSTSC